MNRTHCINWDSLTLRRSPVDRATSAPSLRALAPPVLAVLAMACLATSALSVPALAAAVAAPRVTAVTVFPDRAEVVREIWLQVPAGDSVVEFPGLPWGLEPDSLRASAEGVPAAIGALQLRAEAGDPVESAGFLAARAEVRRLEGELGRLQADAGVDQELRQFLAALRAAVPQHESEGMVRGSADPAALQAVYSLLRSGLGELAGRSLERDERSRRIQEELQVARARMAAEQPPGQIRSRAAAVAVRAEGAGELRVRLAYVTPGAWWRPAYRAALEENPARVLLGLEAVVRQTTGEDWTGVDLTLSTSSPAVGVAPPSLASLVLRPGEPIGYADGANLGLGRLSEGEKREAERSERQAFAADLDLASGVSGLAPVAARRDLAEALRTAHQVTFRVIGPATVTADGREQRLALREEILPAMLRHRAVPAGASAAYVVAEVRAPRQYPLLEGAARVMGGAGYAGAFRLPETAPGDLLEIPFGVDPRVAITRIPIPRHTSREGLTGRDRQEAYGFRTTVQNLGDQPVTLILEERTPVSGDERIRVEVERSTTAGAVEDPERPGVLEWSLSLAPGESGALALDYTVRFPREMVVAGLP